MKTLLIRGGHVVDPVLGIDKPADVLVAGDQIAGIGDPGTLGGNATDTLDASGLIVMPGLVDLHVHLREPGMEKAETIVTGTRAAVAGGFTTIACTPDTDPPIDNEASAEFVFLQAQRANLANVFPIGCLTKDRQGEYLAEIGQLAQSGAVAFSDGDRPVANASLFSKAMRYASMFDKAVIQFPLEATLGGVMNAGRNAARLGLAGMPTAAEEIMISRDSILARDSGAHLHVACVSTRGGLEMIRRAKRDGIRVTCSVTPHHMLLTDDLVERYDASAHKVIPPLRTADHLAALLDGLVDGTVDAVTSNHSPIAHEDKAVEFDIAPAGVIGLETTLALLYTHFVKTGKISLSRLVSLLCVSPAAILGLDAKRSLERGSDADLTLFDPSAMWTAEPAAFHSRSRNTAFAGHEMQGRARSVVVMGKLHDCYALI